MSNINNTTQLREYQQLNNAAQTNDTESGNDNTVESTAAASNVYIDATANPDDPLVAMLPPNTLVFGELPDQPIWHDIESGFNFPWFDLPNSVDGEPTFIYVQGQGDTPKALYEHTHTGSYYGSSTNDTTPFNYKYDTGFGNSAASVARQWNTDHGLGSSFQDFMNYNKLYFNLRNEGSNEVLTVPHGEASPEGDNWNFIGSEWVSNGEIETTSLPVGDTPDGDGWESGEVTTQSTGEFETQTLPAGTEPEAGWVFVEESTTGTGQFETQLLPQGVEPGDNWTLVEEVISNSGEFETLELKAGEDPPEGWTLREVISNGSTTGNILSQSVPVGSGPPDLSGNWTYVGKQATGESITLPEGQTPPAGFELVDTINNDAVTETQELPAGSASPGDGWVKVSTYEKGTGQTEELVVGPNDTEPNPDDGWTYIGDKVIGQEFTSESSSIAIGTNIDGTQDNGFYGQWLQSDRVNDPSYLVNLLEDGDNIEDFRVSGLFSSDNNVSVTTDNQVVDTDISDGIDGNHDHDGYWAGDPVAGTDLTDLDNDGVAYDATVIDPAKTGYFTFHEDYAEDGSGWEVVDHIQVINAEGNIANTGYGFTVKDQSGDVTNLSVQGGLVTINPANGSDPFTFQDDGSGTPYVINDDNGKPFAQFFYADMPGGENGTNERRLVAEKFEYPSARVRQELLDQGVPESYIDNIVKKDEMTLGFRIPDGDGSFRQSAGVDVGQDPILESNSVKTYYDVHLNLDSYEVYDSHVCGMEPIYAKCYEREITEQCDVWEKTTQECQNVYEEFIDVYEIEEQCDTHIYEKEITETQVKYEKEIMETQVTYKKDIEVQIQEWNREVMVQVDNYSNDNPEGQYHLTSPLIADIDKDGKITGNYPVYVDMNGDGKTNLVANGWTPEDAVAVFDGNKDGHAGYVNGQLTSLELLGDNSDIDGDNNPENFANGFEALKALAERHLGAGAIADGVLGTNELAQINAATGFGFMVNGEFKTAAEIGISAINLNYTEEERPDGLGNSINQHSSYVDSQNGTGIFSDAWLRYEETPAVKSLDAMEFISTQNQSQVTQSQVSSTASDVQTSQAEEAVQTTNERPDMVLPDTDPTGLPVSSISDMQPFQMMFMQLIMNFLTQMTTMGPQSYYPQGMPRRFYF